MSQHIEDTTVTVTAAEVGPRDFVIAMNGDGVHLLEVARVDRGADRVRIYFRDANRHPLDADADAPVHITNRGMGFTCVTCGDAFPNYPEARVHSDERRHAVVHAQTRYVLQLDREAHYTLPPEFTL
jgi:hypothetical protein